MKRKIDFQKLVNIYPYYDLSVRFDVFQWMMATGWEYRDRAGMFEVLYGSSGHGNQYYHQDFGFEKRCTPVYPPDFKEPSQFSSDLRLAFVRAIVAKDIDEHVAAWRKAERISLDRYRILELPDLPSYGLVEHHTINRLFNFVGRRLSLQLNEFHPKATVIQAVRLRPSNDGWHVVMRYGYPNEKDGAGWDMPLLPERTGFSNAVLQGIEKLSGMSQVGQQ